MAIIFGELRVSLYPPFLFTYISRQAHPKAILHCADKNFLESLHSNQCFCIANATCSTLSYMQKLIVNPVNNINANALENM